MSFFGPLKAVMFKYRKPKQSFPGSDKLVMGDIPSGPAPESLVQYDPISPRYADVHPPYDPPPSWFEGIEDVQFSPALAIHMDPLLEQRWAERNLDYDRSVAALEVFEQFLHERNLKLHEAEEGGLQPEEAPADPVGQESLADPESREASVDELAAHEEMNGFSPLEQMVLNECEGNTPDAGEQAFSPEAALGPDLDQLTQQAFDQAMQQPVAELEDPFQRMQLCYDQEMQSLLMPFAIPGPFGSPGGP